MWHRWSCTARSGMRAITRSSCRLLARRTAIARSRRSPTMSRRASEPSHRRLRPNVSASCADPRECHSVDRSMNDPSGRRVVGLPPREELAKLSGIQFLTGLRDATLPAPPFSEAAALWPVSTEIGRVVFEANPSRNFYNPMGIVHGGWIAMLLDTAMGCAVHSALEPGQLYTTIEMRTVFVK